MVNLSEFVERLDYLVFESKKSKSVLAAELGINRTTLERYLKGKSLPSYENFIKILEYFSCSANYLLGREEVEVMRTFKPCPPFSQQIEFLLAHYRDTKYHVSRAAKIPEALLYFWRDGKHVPTLEALIKLADHFNCSIDFVLGRADY